MNRLREEYRDRAEFFVVYIQEAHPSDLWQMPSNIRDEVIVQSPLTLDQRVKVANSCVRDLGLEIPALLDDMQDTTDRAYTAWPDRLYVIDVQGRVAYKSLPGPFGFHPDEAEAALSRLLRGPETGVSPQFSAK